MLRCYSNVGEISQIPVLVWKLCVNKDGICQKLQNHKVSNWKCAHLKVDIYLMCGWWRGITEGCVCIHNPNERQRAPTWKVWELSAAVCLFCSLLLSLLLSQNKILQGLSFLKSRETAFTISVSFVPKFLGDFCSVILHTALLSSWSTLGEKYT